MSAAAAQFQFGAEFIGFLAAAAGVALLLLRIELVEGRREVRAGLVVGLVGLAAAAFLDGAHIVPDRSSGAVVALRLGGACVVGASTLAWPAHLRTRILLSAGVLVTALSVAAAAGSRPAVADALVGAGGLAIGAAIVDVSRRSVAARIAASGAASLLILVLVLSVAQSAVIDSNVRTDAVHRLASRAQTEAAAFADVNKRAIEDAALAATGVSADTLFKIANANVFDPTLSNALTYITSLFQGGAAVYFSESGFVLANGPIDRIGLNKDRGDLVQLAGLPLVHSVSCNATAGGTVVLDARAYAFGGFAVCQNGIIKGRMVQVTALDGAYLESRKADDKTLGLALATRTDVLATTAGVQVSSAAKRLVSQVVADGEGRAATMGGLFVSVVPVVGPDGSTAFVLIASSPTSTVVTTRDRLFHILFVIALAGTLVALLLAALVGERIGNRLRRLTTAAERVRRGDPGVRTGLTYGDEVGDLGASFDAMAASIEEKEAALRRAAVGETRLRGRIEAVIGGMGEALVAIDGDGRITDFNRAAEELVGVSATVARGRQAAQVVSLVAEDGTDLSPRLKRPTPTRWTAMASLSPLEGGSIPVAVSAGAMRGPDNELAGGVFVLRDLRAERAVESMKREFLSRASHELRTPLTVIMGYGEMLLRRSPDANQARKFMEEMMTAAVRLDRVVEMLEFFAASAADRDLLRPKPTEVGPLVDEVVRRWTDRLEPPHAISRTVARTLPLVDVDPKWIKIALNELIDNAVKFSPMGGKVQVVVATAEDGSVEISVTDQGIGMTADEQALVFGDFVQGDSSDTRRFSGLGLGLPLARRVAEGHGGTVTCESAPGQGSRLSIVLPAASPPVRRPLRSRSA